MKHRSVGFTLVELLVAIAITSVLVLLLGNIVSAALKVWQQGRNRLDTSSNARFILSRIGDEISGAVAQSGRIQFIEDYPFSPGPTSTAPTAENVFFVAPYPNQQGGDLCAIAYALDTNTHQLQRAFKDSDQAWIVGTANRYRAQGYANAMEWRMVANGVLEFEIQSYSQADIDAPSPTPAPRSAWDSEAAGGSLPKHITLRLKVVDDKTAIALGTFPPGPAYDRLIHEKAREFLYDVTLRPR
jgi:prepilin-type N-terminal cleavage/methylation domain-containing protein